MLVYLKRVNLKKFKIYLQLVKQRLETMRNSAKEGESIEAKKPS
jgi:hypothetical protein